jgi:hypothetical protein
MNSSEVIDRLAAEISEQVYLDIAKWRLNLHDAHLDQVLAAKLHPLLVAGALKEADVTAAMQSINVKIGGGKKELPLTDLVPMQCQINLIDALEKFDL